jgi:hypothetical protein
MFIVLQHRITNPQTAFARGQNLAGRQRRATRHARSAVLSEQRQKLRVLPVGKQFSR